MTNKEWVIRFMIIKNILIIKRMVKIGKIPINLTKRDDLIDLYSWSDHDLSTVKQSIVIAMGNNHASDPNLCPWCIIVEDDCMDCSYGARNGFCDRDSSPYFRLCEELDIYISCLISNEWRNGNRFDLLKKYI